jgi:hypothetical protein
MLPLFLIRPFLIWPVSILVLIVSYSLSPHVNTCEEFTGLEVKDLIPVFC